jgi:hypothetical protein
MTRGEPGASGICPRGGGSLFRGELLVESAEVDPLALDSMAVDSTLTGAGSRALDGAGAGTGSDGGGLEAHAATIVKTKADRQGGRPPPGTSRRRMGDEATPPRGRTPSCLRLESLMMSPWRRYFCA